MKKKSSIPKLRKLKTSNNYYIIWRDEKGNTRRNSTGTSNIGIATSMLAEFMLEEANHSSINPLQNNNGYSICQALDDYYDEHVKIRRSDKERVKYTIKNLKRFFKDMLVSDVAPGGLKYEAQKKIDLYRIQRDAEMRLKKDRPIADSTFHNEINTLNGAFKYAQVCNRITEQERPKIQLPKPSPARNVFLTYKEAETFLDACKISQTRSNDGRYCYSRSNDKLTRTFIFSSLALETAARLQAILDLTWFRVDFDAKIIRYNDEKRLQTSKKRPTVPMSDELYKILLRAKEEATTEYVCFHPGSISSSFATVLRNSGIKKNITPHSLRHTWATWAAMNGIAMEKIAMMLGDSVDVVRNTYVHLCPNYLRDAVNWRTESPKALFDSNKETT